MLSLEPSRSQLVAVVGLILWLRERQGLGHVALYLGCDELPKYFWLRGEDGRGLLWLGRKWHVLCVSRNASLDSHSGLDRPRFPGDQYNGDWDMVCLKLRSCRFFGGSICDFINRT